MNLRILLNRLRSFTQQQRPEQLYQAGEERVALQGRTGPISFTWQLLEVALQRVHIRQ